MVKHRTGTNEWVAEEESGVMLPVLDGTGEAFVPDILTRDTEFLLEIAAKTRW